VKNSFPSFGLDTHKHKHKHKHKKNMNNPQKKERRKKKKINKPNERSTFNESAKN
jgi:hypothetical protein